MPKRSSSASPKLDTNQLAHRIARIAAGEDVPSLKRHRKNPAAVALGRRGGLQGGKARAAAHRPAGSSNRSRRSSFLTLGRSGEGRPFVYRNYLLTILDRSSIFLPMNKLSLDRRAAVVRGLI